MNPLDVLQAQRDRICALLDGKVEGSDGGIDGDGNGTDPSRDPIAAAGREFERYLDMEERVLYPRVDDLLGDRGVEVDAAIDRHREMLAALQRLDRAGSDDKPAAARSLSDLLRTHVELSEREIFRRLRLEADEDDFQNLGDALEEARLSAEEADVDLPPPMAASGAPTDAPVRRD